MGIKKHVQIAAEVLAVKPSRIAAMAAEQRAERMTAPAARLQQASRLLREAERLREEAERLLREDADIRPSTHKVKRGKQGLPGRTRVDRQRQAVVTAKHILELENMLADMAVSETLKDERGYAYSVSPEVGLRWKHPARLVVGTTGFYSNATCWFVPTIEGLMAFEDELIDQHALPREYVTPDDIVRVTGRRLGK